VVLAHGEGAERRLAAYLVAVHDEAGAPLVLDPDELRSQLRERLPEYMVPGAFVLLDALPLTPNGKLDRAALPRPGAALLRREYVPPRTPEEAALAAVWARVLGVERVGALDDFFDLGGHSLLVMQVVARLRDETGVDLPVRALFETPVLADAAAAVVQAKLAHLSRDDLSTLVEEVAHLSEEEVALLLAEDTGSATNGGLA
jgi:acyl carrier protein